MTPTTSWPAAKFVVIATVALAVGANTAMFSLVNALFLRPLPYPDPDRLVKILEGSVKRPANLRGMRGTNNVAPANLLSWREMASSFEVMGAYGFVTSNLVGSGEPERLGVDLKQRRALREADPDGRSAPLRAWS